jgi:hypothetical protein
MNEAVAWVKHRALNRTTAKGSSATRAGEGKWRLLAPVCWSPDPRVAGDEDVGAVVTRLARESVSGSSRNMLTTQRLGASRNLNVQTTEKQ